MNRSTELRQIVESRVGYNLTDPALPLSSLRPREQFTNNSCRDALDLDFVRIPALK
jgi:hypothetical protein